MNAWMTLLSGLLATEAPRLVPIDASAPADDLSCKVVDADNALPREIRESSGLARSGRNPDLFWTHNDSGNDPVLFAVGKQGELVGRVVAKGATLRDWEDIDAAPCAGERCLYIADIGDNDGVRPSITIYRVTEPNPTAPNTEPVAPLVGKFPDRPQDAEAIFVRPGGEIFVITKGRHGPVTLYRYPREAGAGSPATLTRVRELLPKPQTRDDMVTGASASPDGKWIAVRTYRTLYVYPAASLIDGKAGLDPRTVDLAPLGHKNGEAVVMANDGAVWLTSEAKGKRAQPGWIQLQCAL